MRACARARRAPRASSGSAAFRTAASDAGAPGASAGSRAGQLDDECRALAGCAAQADRALEAVSRLRDDPQAQAHAALHGRRLQLLEALEDPLVVAFGQPDAVIADDDAHARRAAPDGYLERLARAELDRVADQVGDDLAQANLVPAAADRPFALDVDRTLRGADLLLEQADGLAHESVQIQ